MNLVRYADRPDLMERRFEELSRPTFPAYMNQSEVADPYRERLYTDFADFQVASPPRRRRPASPRPMRYRL